MEVSLNMKATGEQIRKKCDEKGISPEEISKLFNLDMSTPYYWFQGKSLPRWELAFNLARLLDCKLEDLFVLDTEDDEENIEE